MAEQSELSFAGLLRQLRAEARLTQEELAEAAGISPRSVSDLERGISRTAHKDTARLLADALGMADPVREMFVAAARGKAAAGEVLEAGQGVTSGAFAATATRALPRDVAGFTGRGAELSRLTGAVADLAQGGAVVGIHAIGGMAGVGKTAFAVHAAHALAPRFPDGQFFLPLHAHTAGQRPVQPEDGLASLLLAAGVPARQIPQGLEARAARWRHLAAGRQVLVVLDDAAGHAQVRPLLPGSAGSVVLITSRRRLTALPDAAVVSLDAMPADDAAELLARGANRSDLLASDAAVGELARLCGYLPLALGMVAAQLRHHPARTAAQLARSMDSASGRLAALHAEDLSVAAAFDLSYAGLAEGPQRLFRRLGLVPGPSVDGYAAAALAETGVDAAGRLLDELYDQHLLTEPSAGRYVMHDLLREFARTLVAADGPAECDAATGRLLDYYLHTALAAGAHIPVYYTAQSRLPTGPPPPCGPSLTTLAKAAAWLETERPNLYAATHHAAARGQALHAVQIPAAIGELLRIHGDWDQASTLHTIALATARQARDRPGQALALRQLGTLAMHSGDFPAAAANLTHAASLYSETKDGSGQAYALVHLGVVQQQTGDYPAALASRQQALKLACGGSDRFAEAVALRHLGEIQRLTGDYAAAAANLQQALVLFRALGIVVGEADALGDLGGLQTETGDYAAAEASLSRSLLLWTSLGVRMGQAWVLNELGLLQQRTGDHAAAAASHQQALELHRDLGDLAGVADTLNNLGELSSRTTATSQARDHHNQALILGRDIGARLVEARALEGIGCSHLQDGHPGKALDNLRHALTIYQRVGSPGAYRVQETLRLHRLEPALPGTPNEEPLPTTAARSTTTGE